MTEKNKEPFIATSFFVAAFGIDGEFVGIKKESLDSLSDKWIYICRDYLRHYGEDFDVPWSGNLSHIRTKFTSEAGAALATFSVDGKIASSIALSTGFSKEAELLVLKMFANSLRRIEIVKNSAKSSEPFEEIFSIDDRPLMILVQWADPEISEQDLHLIRELSLHFAAAYLMQDRPAFANQ
ncbi:hypothetical protein [Variovorax sp. Varisp36]|uniref:hypothetical protein n=1 Tax=Variovorax sp. Varisp36 TaxID=3243031 RepID=UPI0039A4070F